METLPLPCTADVPLHWQFDCNSTVSINDTNGTPLGVFRHFLEGSGKRLTGRRLGEEPSVLCWIPEGTEDVFSQVQVNPDFPSVIKTGDEQLHVKMKALSLVNTLQFSNSDREVLYYARFHGLLGGRVEFHDQDKRAVAEAKRSVAKKALCWRFASESDTVIDHRLVLGLFALIVHEIPSSS